MIKIFSGVIRTTDGKKWSVGFEALSWEDAESLAEALCVSELGLCQGTTIEEDPDPYDLDDPDIGNKILYYISFK